MNELNEFLRSFQGFTVVVSLIAIVIKIIGDFRNSRVARERVLDAEKEAFRTIPKAVLEKTKELADSQDQLEQRAKELANLVERAQGALSVGILFDVYSKRIEKYQTETQARAGWSFIFAIVAMLSGLSFVVWGGMEAVTSNQEAVRIAGATVSAIGAALSAFITKTFLDVHKLSLSQLNRYFRQPVLNSHVLTAQRLADQLDDPAAKEEAYRAIIQRLALLIREDPQAPDTEPAAAKVMTETAKKRTAAKKVVKEDNG